MDDKKTAEDLATLGDRGRAASEARLLEWSERHPTRRCEHCAGAGNYVERATERRPFDSRNFSAAQGDRYVATCPECRGLGRVFVTQEEHVAAVEAELDAARAEYRAIRDEVCKLRGIEASAFDRIARRQIDLATPSPHDWLAAARAVRGIYL